MNKQIEALKMAVREMSVYAMQHSNDWLIEDVDLLKAINACKEALAEAEKQEPVAWNEEEFNAIAYAYRICPSHEIKMVSERYQDLVDYVLSITHPATWQSLSDDEINEYWYQSNNDVEGVRLGFTTQQHYFARAIEQALKENNHPCK